jgi:polyisoprenoid-binding protein YceI
MRVSARWKLRSSAALLATLLAGCPLPPRAPAPPSAALPAAAAPHAGVPYDIVPEASLLTILVYRAGPLASAGHNHVIASHTLSGTIYVADEPQRSSFELRVPVAEFTVDEQALRAQQSAADFPPDVPESAKEGTRHNMLGPQLLDAEHYPEITLRAVRLDAAPGPGAATAANGGAVQAHVEATVRGAQHAFDVPVRYELGSGQVVASGELTLRQSDLGLTPFSAMLGALQVKDEMHVSFRIVARQRPRA